MGVCVVLKPSSPPNAQEDQIKHGEETACHLQASRGKSWYGAIAEVLAQYEIKKDIGELVLNSCTSLIKTDQLFINKRKVSPIN